MEFKTIIYIIAAIIYLYNRSKKKDKNPTGQTQSEEQGEPDAFDWEETIRKLSGEQVEKNAPQPIVEAPTRNTQKQQDVFTYESTTPRTIDYDEEIISQRQIRDWDTEVLKRKHTRNMEEEALKRNKAQSLEQQKSMARSVSLVAPLDVHEEEHAKMDLSFDADEFRKGFIYGEIFKPKHF